jgi:hypothetical protein
MFNDNGTYKVGSIVHKQNSENGEISKLLLPGGKFSRQCVNSPIYFKNDVELSCLLKNDESGCTGKYSNFAEIDKIEIDSTGEESNFIKPTITCIDSTGVEINPCRSSVFVPSTFFNKLNLRFRISIRIDVQIYSPIISYSLNVSSNQINFSKL